MKCEHCGKNEVQFVYHSNINGKVEEAHLCAECAEKLGYGKRMSLQQGRLMQDFLRPGRFFGDTFFDDFFSPLPSLLGRSGLLADPFAALLQEENPVSAAPKAENVSQEAAKEPETPAQAPEESRFARARRLNALRLAMKDAIDREDFERAAQVRDEIRALEAESPENG